MIFWDAVEPSEGLYDWGYVDNLLQPAISNGLDIVVIFVNPPTWASGDETVFFQQYSTFISSFASRYRGVISYYSPVNEPKYKGYPVEKCVKYIENCYYAVKNSDPDAKIFGPEVLALSGPELQYFSDVLNTPGICEKLDAISFHYYARPPYHVSYPTAADSLFGKVHNDYLPAAQSACGAKPLWVGEWGVRSNEVEEEDPQDLYPDQEIEYEDAYSRAFEDLDLERLYIFRMHDCCPASPAKWGLLENLAYGGSVPLEEAFPPKPSFWTIKNLISGIREDVEGNILIKIDASSPPYFLSVNQANISAWTSGMFDDTEAYNDCNWSPLDDYQGLSGVDAFVSHPGPGPVCECDGVFENSEWLGIHVSGLRNGAPYKIYLRLLVIQGLPSGHEDTRGILAHIPDFVGWRRFDQTEENYTTIQELHDTIQELHDGLYNWEEWEVFLGEAKVVNGELKVFFDDVMAQGGSQICTFREANIIGIRLENNFFVPKEVIFADGFESGNISEWS